MVLQEARTKAEDLVREAEGLIAVQERDNATEKERLSNRRRVLNKDEKDWQKDMEKREAAITEKLDIVAVKTAQASQKMDEARALYTKYDDKILELKAVGVDI